MSGWEGGAMRCLFLLAIMGLASTKGAAHPPGGPRNQPAFLSAGTWHNSLLLRMGGGAARSQPAARAAGRLPLLTPRWCAGGPGVPGGRAPFGASELRKGGGSCAMQAQESPAASQQVVGAYGGGGDPEEDAERRKGADKEREYEVQRGHCIDTLLHDYPEIFHHAPDFSIFREDVSLKDSAGFTSHGMTLYKGFFSALRMIVPIVYHQAVVSVHVMNKYDMDKSRIRLRWKIELFRQAGPVNLETPEQRQKHEALRRMGFSVPDGATHCRQSDKVVEGVSVYKLDANGRIYWHEIETTEPTSMSEQLVKLKSYVPIGADLSGCV